MSQDPSDADVALRAAVSLVERGDAAAAERHCRKALAARPGDPAALAVLGISLNAQGRFAAAVRIFAELTRRQPHVRSHWMNLGTAARAAKQYDDALLAYARAGALGERSADFFYNVGLLHMDRGAYETARTVLADARRLAPRDAEIACQYAQCCYESLRTEEALAALGDWQQLEGLTASQIARIALLLMNLGEPARARVALERAAADPATDTETSLRLAQIMERSNRLTEARERLAQLRSRSLPSGLAEDVALLDAQLAQREGRHADAASLFAGLSAACDEPHRRHLYLFPLAKSLDALRRYEEAYEALVQAHEAQRLHLLRTMPEAAALREAPMLITRYGCDPEDVSAWQDPNAPPVEESPVFIVAFPRSGTTLLEQALDAHPSLATMDEQPYLQYAIDRIMQLGVGYPHRLSQLEARDLDGVRAAYRQLAARKVQLGPGQRLIDKNPLNLLRLPAIRRLFPNSRILLVIRHPCDVILSCFMQHFRAPEFALLCRDLPSLARGYRRAFDFWYQQAGLLSPAVHEIRYESFVEDFATRIRDVADFLELPWDGRMLQPAEHALAKGFISTPSYAQVVQPVNRRSVGRWRPYERHFAQALTELQPYLARWSYER